MKILKAPLSISLGVTNRCNLKCGHCYMADTKTADDLNIEQLLDIVRQIKELKIFRVAITGGEPFLRKDLFRILKELDSLNTSISINTNASLINRELARGLSGFNIKNYVVSLDGASPKIHDFLRGNGSFEKTINGIINLVREKEKVIISTTVTRLNYRDIENITLLAKQIGAFKARFNRIVYSGNARCYKKRFQMTLAQRKELFWMARKVLARFGDFVTGSLFQVVHSKGKREIRHEEKFFLLMNGCRAGIEKCVIRPDGTVVPCEILWDIKAGDLRKKSLKEIWNNSKVLKSFRGAMDPESIKKIYCWKEDFMKGIN